MNGNFSQAPQGGPAISHKDEFGVVRGTGNVFRDLGHPNPELEQLRSILNARIITALDTQKLTVRKTHEMAGRSAADFSRLRRANLGRLSVDRLMMMLTSLGQEVEVTVRDRAREERRIASVHSDFILKD